VDSFEGLRSYDAWFKFKGRPSGETIYVGIEDVIQLQEWYGFSFIQVDGAGVSRAAGR